MRYDDFRDVMSRSEPSHKAEMPTIFRRASDDDGAIYKGGYVAPTHDGERRLIRYHCR